MTFPLPPGCRKVCRPVRDPPRVVQLSTVVRMARAAVAHGADSCELVARVAEAVDCQKCKDEVENVRLGIEAVLEALADLVEAIYDLVDAILGVKVPRDEPPEPGDNVRIKTIWERIKGLLRGVLLILRIKEVVDAILDFLDAWSRFQEVLTQFLSDVNALANCASGGQ